MFARTLAVGALTAAALVAPVVPAEAATTTVSVRLSTATFTGKIWVTPSSIGRPTRIRAESTSCNVAGLRLTTPVPTPFVTSLCEFRFDAPASISAACSGVVLHPSYLTYIVPVTRESVVIRYETRTVVTEGNASGHGVNSLGLGSVHFTGESICVTEDQADAEGNLAGHASAT